MGDIKLVIWIKAARRPSKAARLPGKPWDLFKNSIRTT